MTLNKRQSSTSRNSLDADTRNPSDSLASANSPSFVITPTMLALVFGGFGLANVFAVLMSVSMTTLRTSFGEAYMANMITISSIMFPLVLTFFIGKVLWNLVAARRQ